MSGVDGPLAQKVAVPFVPGFGAVTFVIVNVAPVTGHGAGPVWL